MISAVAYISQGFETGARVRMAAMTAVSGDDPDVHLGDRTVEISKHELFQPGFLDLPTAWEGSNHTSDP